MFCTGIRFSLTCTNYFFHTITGYQLGDRVGMLQGIIVCLEGPVHTDGTARKEIFRSGPLEMWIKLWDY